MIIIIIINKILSRLRDILPKQDRKEIIDKLYETEHQSNISEDEKEENDEYFRKLVKILNNKEKYSTHDYYGIRNIPILLGQTSEEHCYEPILVKTSFNSNYKYYESNGDKEQILSVTRLPHIYMI